MIDLCVTNLSANRISCSVLQEDQISDHAIIEFNLSGKVDHHATKSRNICVWKDYDTLKLWQSIDEWKGSWKDIEHRSVNDKTNWLLENISSTTNQFKKMKTIKINEDLFDNQLEEMRLEKNRFYNVAQYTVNDPETAKKRWHEYRCYKNDYKNMIQNKKYQHNQKRLSKVKGDQKGTWKVLNSILNKQSDEIVYIKDGNQSMKMMIQLQENSTNSSLTVLWS